MGRCPLFFTRSPIENQLMIRTRSLAAPGLAASGLLAGLLFAAALPAQQPSRLSLVDPLVGTTNGGNTTPGAQGALRLRLLRSGHHYRQQLHQTAITPQPRSPASPARTRAAPGGEGKYGNFRTTPTVGTLSPPQLALRPGPTSAPRPAYYAVTLITPAPPSTPTQQVRTELTASRLVAYSRYTFPAHTQANILLDVSSRIRLKGGRSGRPQRVHGRHQRRPSPSPTLATPPASSPSRAAGTPPPYTLYFAAELSRPATSMGTWDEHRTYPNRLHAEGIDQTPHSPESYRNQLGAYFTFASADAPHHDAPCRLLPQHRKGPPEPRCRVPPHLRRRPRPGPSSSGPKRSPGSTSPAARPTSAASFIQPLYRSHIMPHDLTGRERLVARRAA